MKKSLLFILLFASCVLFVDAQNVTIKEDFPISKMMDAFVAKNKSTYKIEGWRIQILATTDRRKMEEAKAKFLANYPDISIDWTHSKPYYRLRAGAFTSKLDAVRLLHKLKEDYPSAYPAKDFNINPQELVDSQ
jgi:SPOR domain